MKRALVDMLLALAAVPINLVGLPLLLLSLRQPALAEAIGVIPLTMVLLAPTLLWLEWVKPLPSNQCRYRRRLRDAAVC